MLATVVIDAKVVKWQHNKMENAVMKMIVKVIWESDLSGWWFLVKNLDFFLALLMSFKPNKSDSCTQLNASSSAWYPNE